MTPIAPAPDTLSMPVGALAAHNDPVQKGTSLRVAAHALAESGLHALPVADGRRVVGLIDEGALLQALGMGLDPNDPVEAVMDSDPAMLPPHATGAQALRIFDASGRHAIVVVDMDLQVVGLLTPSRLFHRPQASYRPQLVGGMATPFGVYLTNGVVGGGAKGIAIATSGMTLFGIFFVAAFVVTAFANILKIDQDAHAGLLDFASMLLFLVGLRVIPLAGTHGAEHMVVHAIERGEELTPDVVRRMSRVHPRCGTNIAVGAMVFLSLFAWEWTRYDEIRLMVAIFATLFLWKPLGSFVQYFFTTKPPNEGQLLSGIRAGKELLAASARAPYSRGNVLQRIYASGLLHVIAGATLAQLVAMGVLRLLHLPDSWQVLS